MRSNFVFVWVALLLFVGNSAVAQSVMLTAADGVKIYGRSWPVAGPRAAPLVLAFHQAESSHVEYEPLAPRLNRAGFSVLAIDQRSGGREFGGENQTAKTLGSATSYDDALADLEAAVAWGHVHAHGAPLVVWGSSYSAALVFVLASRHPADVQGVLAFSPGEYLSEPDAVRRAARTIRLPVFIDQASDRDEIAASRAVFDALPGSDKTLFVPTTSGVHGAATLRSDRNAKGAEENWNAVMTFLARFKARQ